jgi:uncharacterized membrane protein YkvA (DUF1232 family)
MVAHLLISLLWVAALLAVAWGAVLVALVVGGRREEAAAAARLLPDLIVMVKRLLADGRVPRRSKFALWLTLGYLASPLDLVPDFVPVAGQLDDALVVGLALRYALRHCEADLLGELWPGPPASLALLARVVGRGKLGQAPRL